jgi:hypothetical protein
MHHHCWTATCRLTRGRAPWWWCIPSSLRWDLISPHGLPSCMHCSRKIKSTSHGLESDSERKGDGEWLWISTPPIFCIAIMVCVCVLYLYIYQPIPHIIIRRRRQKKRVIKGTKES